MLASFRNTELQRLWRLGKPVSQKTLVTQHILDALDVIDAAGSPRDPAFIGFRFDEWNEKGEQRYGVMVSDHWLISYGWSDGHAIDVDLERLE
jgi:plasmid maintenance system killer protein